MTTPTTPVYGPDDYLLLRELEKRTKSLEELLAAIPAAERAETIEQITAKTAALKQNLFKDIDNLTEKFSEMSRVFTSLRRETIETYDQSLRDQTVTMGNFVSQYKKYFGDAGISLEDFKNKIKNLDIGDPTNLTRRLNDLRREISNSIDPDKIKEEIERFRISLTTLRTVASESFSDVDEMMKKLEISSGITQEKIKKTLSSFDSSIDLENMDQVRDGLYRLRLNLSEVGAAGTVTDKVFRDIKRSILDSSENFAKLASISHDLAETQLLIAQRTEPLIKMQEMAAKSGQRLTSTFGDYADKLSLASSANNIFATSLINIFANGKWDDSTNKLKLNFTDFGKSITSSLATSFLDPEKAANRLFNFLNENVIKSTFEFDKMIAGVNKTTGGFGQEFKNIAFESGGTATPELARLGMTLKDVSESYGILSKNIGGFNLMTESQRKLLTVQATEFKTLGLSAEMYGKLSSNFMASLGKDAAGANETIKQLAKDAIGLGRELGQYAQEFQGMIGKLSGYGQEATEIFKSLSGIANATKGAITAADLGSISDQFKTFDGAAEAANKLSAAFGGVSVSAMDMMRMNPQEQIMAIKRAADASGMSFDGLNIGYKRMLAEFFGGDVSKAAAFFKMDMMEATSAINDAVTSEEELNKRKEQSASAQEKLNAAFENLKIALSPIAEALGMIANMITGVTSFLGPFPTTMIVIAGLAKTMGKSFLSFGAAAELGGSRAMKEMKLLQAEAAYAMEVQAAAKAGSPPPGPQPSGQLVSLRSDLGVVGPVPPTGGGGFSFMGMGGWKGVAGIAVLGAAMAGAAAWDNSKKDKEVDDGLITISKAGQTKVIGINDQDDVSIMAAKAGGPLSKTSEANSNITNSSQFNSFVSYAQNLGTSLSEYTKDITSSFISEGGSFFSDIGNNIKETFVASQEKSSLELQQISGNTIKESVSKLQENSAAVKTAERETFIKDVRESNTQLVKETKSAMPENLAITLRPTFTEGYAGEMFNVGLDQSRRKV